MKPSTAGRAAVWTAAISVSGMDPHTAPAALGAAVAKEAFDLLRVRSHRASVLAYLQAASGANTYLNIGPSPVGPSLVLSVASPGSSRPDDKEGAEHVPADPDPADFCRKQRADWLGYARVWTRNWADAEDAVSHAVLKVFEHHAAHGTLCPGGRDPVGWSKTIIRNYVIDQFRWSDPQRRRRLAFMLPDTYGADVADEVTDRIIVRKSISSVESLKGRAHVIAVMRYIEGRQPQEIADELHINPSTVRTSLHRTAKKMRTQVGVAEPRKVFKEETT
jgi:RNA polymerase sigma factor (sigma-70 family)